jgi:NADH dehydrogenase FAD-containing subunit
VKEHAHFLKDVKDARSIRIRILECFEQASQPILSDVERRKLLNFCIVGGGPTGVEFSAELHDLLHSDIQRHYPMLARMAKITLYDTAPSILGSFDKSLIQYAESTFRRDGISILTRHHVERVEAGRMYVREQGEVSFGLLVWSTGLAANPLIESISEVSKQEKSGKLITDEFLNVLKTDGSPNPDVFAVGDAAEVRNAPLPATAQVAYQKAQYAYKRLNKIVKDEEYPKAFEFHNQGSMAYIGDWKAIYDRSSAETGPKMKESGRMAWLLWRSAYFTMTLSWRNKILVAVYWFMNWIFGRDLTRF